MLLPSTYPSAKLAWHWADSGSNLIANREGWCDIFEAHFPLSWYDNPAAGPLAVLSDTLKQIGQAGFVYIRSQCNLVVTKAVMHGHADQFCVRGYLYFIKDDLALQLPITAQPDDTLQAALTSMHVQLHDTRLISSVQVARGIGQCDRARQQAADMLRRAGPARALLTACEVDCRTRSGDGGWHERTMTRRFDATDFTYTVEGRR